MADHRPRTLAWSVPVAGRRVEASIICSCAEFTMSADRSNLQNMATAGEGGEGADGPDRGSSPARKLWPSIPPPTGVTPIVPKPLTSGAKATGGFGPLAFLILPTRPRSCPAGEPCLALYHGEKGRDGQPIMVQ